MEFFNDAPNPIYGIHNPVGIKYLTRLRVGLFICTSSITISETLLLVLVPVGSLKLSNTTYFIALTTRLIRSALFAKLRTFISLLTLTSSSYTCNLLLFGNPNFDFYTNKKILEITICFITTSKRFLVPLID